MPIILLGGLLALVLINTARSRAEPPGPSRMQVFLAELTAAQKRGDEGKTIRLLKAMTSKEVNRWIATLPTPAMLEGRRLAKLARKRVN